MVIVNHCTHLFASKLNECAVMGPALSQSMEMANIDLEAVSALITSVAAGRQACRWTQSCMH